MTKKNKGNKGGGGVDNKANFEKKDEEKIQEPEVVIQEQPVEQRQQVQEEEAAPVDEKKVEPEAADQEPPAEKKDEAGAEVPVVAVTEVKSDPIIVTAEAVDQLAAAVEQREEVQEPIL